MLRTKQRCKQLRLFAAYVACVHIIMIKLLTACADVLFFFLHNNDKTFDNLRGCVVFSLIIWRNNSGNTNALPELVNGHHVAVLLTGTLLSLHTFDFIASESVYCARVPARRRL